MLEHPESMSSEFILKDRTKNFLIFPCRDAVILVAMYLNRDETNENPTSLIFEEEIAKY